MASPYLFFSDLLTLASNGGYQGTVVLSQLSTAFLLSACTYLREQWLWQNPISPISDSVYQDIVDMIEQTEYELMANVLIGTIVPSVTELSAPNFLLLNGGLVLATDYPELAAKVPDSWIVGTAIVLPNMDMSGLFGSEDILNAGTFTGENAHVLSVGELASHTHIQNPHNHSEIIPTVLVSAAGLEPALASFVTATPSLTGLTTATNQNTGNNEGHNNIQRSMLVQWYIVAQ